MAQTWTAMLKRDQVGDVIAAARRLKDLELPPDNALEKQIAYPSKSKSPPDLRVTLRPHTHSGIPQFPYCRRNPRQLVFDPHDFD